ncbi:hypothetical protein AVEN_156212-1 [Araneus ventricosus]|uniref:Uncharacterized protein n=1 Tax=Araneus ventricosus TaxID=182803 RepID=A0A4Y2NWF5_ARAVE|nr:hypothetical protein AVEN_156212-1 [Araneus ventricosus]
MFLVSKKRWVPLVNPESARNQKRGEQKRQILFDEFWLTVNWDLKNMFVCSTVDIKSTNRKTVKGDDTHEFYNGILCEEESRRQVARKCKNTEHISDGKNKKVTTDETDKKKKDLKKDKKNDKRRL